MRRTIASDPATHLAVFSAPVAQAGAAVAVEVVALDASNQPTSDFTDEISLGSTDATATVGTSRTSAGTGVPLDYQFLATDNGHQEFPAAPAALESARCAPKTGYGVR